MCDVVCVARFQQYFSFNIESSMMFGQLFGKNGTIGDIPIYPNIESFDIGEVHRSPGKWNSNDSVFCNSVSFSSNVTTVAQSQKIPDQKPKTLLHLSFRLTEQDARAQDTSYGMVIVQFTRFFSKLYKGSDPNCATIQTVTLNLELVKRAKKRHSQVMTEDEKKYHVP